MMIPHSGSIYNFYDDGKKSRLYKATILRVISKEEAKEVFFPTYCNHHTDWIPSTMVFEYEEPIGKQSLYDKWLEVKDEIDWVFADNTDYFIECSIPEYDDYTIWFARTNEGGWFSMDIQSDWQGGLLDTNKNKK